MSATNQTNTGKVKFYAEGKNYGFITDDVDKVDYFFHASGTLDRVHTEDEVAYDLENGKKGLKAVNVRRRKKIN